MKNFIRKIARALGISSNDVEQVKARIRREAKQEAARIARAALDKWVAEENGKNERG